MTARAAAWRPGGQAVEECVCRVVQFVVKMKAGDSVLSKVWTNLWPFMSLKAPITYYKLMSSYHDQDELNGDVFV